MFSKSKIFLYLMLSFLWGVFLASFSLSLFWLLLFFAVFLLFFFSFFHLRHLILLFFVFLLSLFGFFYYKNSLAGELSLKNSVGFEVELEGVVVTEAERRSDREKFVLETKQKERILIIKDRYPEYDYGDLLFVRGFLKEPENFENFDYVNYLAKDDIYFLIRNPKIEKRGENKASLLLTNLFSLKKSFQDNIKRFLPSPEADFINGVLFGSKEEIPKDLYQDFINTGTAHIIALSGFNITIIVVFLSWIFSFLLRGQKVVLFSSIIVIALFVIMTGASSSVVRAAIMGSVLLLANYYGRAKYALNALLFAGVVMVLFNPKILVFDISFQLSFLATLGLLYIYPYLSEKFNKIPNIFSLRDTISATISAQIAVLPILIYNFKQLSLIAPIVNVLVLPLIPPAMLLGFLLGLFAFFFDFLAKFFAFFLWFILHFQIMVIEYFSDFSFSVLNF